jgi:hypothetical protein
VRHARADIEKDAYLACLLVGHGTGANTFPGPSGCGRLAGTTESAIGAATSSKWTVTGGGSGPLKAKVAV